MQTSARFPEDDPQKADHAVYGHQAVPVGDARPDPSWEIDRLVIYAKGEMANSKEAKRQAILQARKEAIHLFRAGHALALARDKSKAQHHGDWKNFKEQHDLADTTANDAIRLYERAKTEDALIGLGITEAKEKFGIAKPKKSKKAAPNPAPAQQPALSPGTGVAPNEAAPDAAHDDEEGVPKAQEGLGEVGQHEGDTTDAAIETTEGGDQQDDADETSLTGKTAQTLADELEAIAQRLSEIGQDDFGKVSWTKAEHRKANNAVAAVKKSVIVIQRRLNNEDPVS